MVVLQKSENQIYADIVRSLKQNFRTEISPSSVAPGERKVRIRTNCHYKSQVSDDHWREKYNRNVKQSVRGFYTPAHVPYASVGDVCLDIKDLVVKTVGGDQRSEKSKNLRLIADPREQERKKVEERAATGQKKSQRSAKKRACFSFQDQGGLSEIKAKLFQYRGRLSAVRAGQAFQECLVKENIMHMVVKAMKEHKSQMHEPAMSPAKLKKMLSKWKLSERSDAPLQGDELIPAFPSEIKSEHEEEIVDQRDVRDRYVRNFSNKLSCLYTLLCYIYHLRTRDLRTRAPLSRDFLKALKTEVLTDQKGRPLRHTRNMFHIHPHSRGPGNQRSSTDATVSRMEHDNHLSPHMNTRASFVSDSPSSLFRTGTTANGAIESRASFFGRKLRIRDQSDKIETWDDLLEAGDKPPSNPQAPWPGMARGGVGGEAGARGGITRTSFLHAGKMMYGGRQRRYGLLQSLVNQAQSTATVEQAPLWQQVATSEKNAKDSGTSGTCQKRRVKKSPSKIESSLSDMMSEGFVKIQAKSAERVRDKLSKVNRKERESFMKKVLAFEPSSLYAMDLKRVQQAGREVSEEYEKEGVKTARWYGDLEHEARELGVGKDIEVMCLFNKLYPFAIDDVTTLPFVQAKLCLVVQSLPVYELCSLTMLDAIKFLLVKILNSSPGTFNEWMNQRKLLPGDKPS